MDFNKKIFIFAISPLFVLALFLMTLTSAGNVQSADCDCEERELTDVEKIYEEVRCTGGDSECSGEGKTLFALYGTDADCEKRDKFGDKILCYTKHSYAYQVCEEISDFEKRGECYNRFFPVIDYYYGGAGTFINEKKLTIGGSRTYLTGFDENGQHKIMANFVEPGGRAMIFRDRSRDVEFGYELNTPSIQILSDKGGLYFSDDIQFEEVPYYDTTDLEFVLAGKAKNILYIAGEDSGYPLRKNGFSMSSYLEPKDEEINYQDLLVTANYHNIITGVDIENRGGLSGPWGGDLQYALFEKGLEVGGDLKTYNIIYKGLDLLWTEPIRGNFILYYR